MSGCALERWEGREGDKGGIFCVVLRPAGGGCRDGGGCREVRLRGLGLGGAGGLEEGGGGSEEDVGGGGGGSRQGVEKERRN